MSSASVCFLIMLLVLIQSLSSTRIKVSPSDQQTLSPRTVKMKYGNCRGVINTLTIVDPTVRYPAKNRTGSNERKSKLTSETQKRSKLKEKGKVMFVEVFKGIPFASAPLGSLRFMPPVTPSYWLGTKFFTAYEAICPQSVSSNSPIQDHSSSNSESIFHPKTFKSSSSSDHSIFSSSLSDEPKSKSHPHNRNESSSNTSNISSSANKTMTSDDNHSRSRVHPSTTSTPSASSSSSSSLSREEEKNKEVKREDMEDEERNKKERRRKYFLSNQSEDCLYLNIFSPFNYDSRSGNQLDGSILAAKSNIIVVTLNFRLGILGFLPTLIDGRKRGNFGLLDSVAALHWVHDCIVPFGGDSDRVTIAGHGVGGQFLELLLLTPLARGLFSRAIIMSGSSLSPLFTPLQDLDSGTLSLSKSLSCPSPSFHDHMMECLRSKSFEEIIQVQETWLREIDDVNDPFEPLKLGIIIDGLVVPRDPQNLMALFDLPVANTMSERIKDQVTISQLLTSPSRAANQGFRGHDILSGFKMKESWTFVLGERQITREFLSGQLTPSGLEASLKSLVKHSFKYYQEVILLALINEYSLQVSRDLMSPKHNESWAHMESSFSDLLNDGLVVSPMVHFQDSYRQLLDKMQDQRASPHVSSRIFSYTFNLRGSSLVKNSDSRGELHFLLGMPLMAEDSASLSKSIGNSRNGNLTRNFNQGGDDESSSKEEDDIFLSELVMNNWGHFVHHGFPCHPFCGLNISSTSLSATTSESPKSRIASGLWPEYDPVTRSFLQINVDPTIVSKKATTNHRINFWNELVPSLQRLGGQESAKLIQYLKDLEARGLQEGENSHPRHTGVFNTIQLKFLSPLSPPQHPSLLTPASPPLKDISTPGLFGDLRNKNVVSTSNGNSFIQDEDDKSSKEFIKNKSNTSMTQVTTRLTTHSSSSSSLDLLTESALGLTITIGITMFFINLILFMVIFACYKKKRNFEGMISQDAKMNTEEAQEQYSQQRHVVLEEMKDSPCKSMPGGCQNFTQREKKVMFADHQPERHCDSTSTSGATSATVSSSLTGTNSSLAWTSSPSLQENHHTHHLQSANASEINPNCLQRLANEDENCGSSNSSLRRHLHPVHHQLLPHSLQPDGEIMVHSHQMKYLGLQTSNQEENVTTYGPSTSQGNLVLGYPEQCLDQQFVVFDGYPVMDASSFSCREEPTDGSTSSNYYQLHRLMDGDPTNTVISTSSPRDTARRTRHALNYQSVIPSDMFYASEANQ